jgi:hypothetical protein
MNLIPWPRDLSMTQKWSRLVNFSLEETTSLTVFCQSQEQNFVSIGYYTSSKNYNNLMEWNKERTTRTTDVLGQQVGIVEASDTKWFTRAHREVLFITTPSPYFAFIRVGKHHHKEIVTARFVEHCRFERID